MNRIVTEEKIEYFKKTLIYDEKSDSTVQKYMRDVRAFQQFLAGEPVTKELVIKYKHNLIERYAPTSVNSMLAAVNRLLKEFSWHDCVVKTLKIQRQAFRTKEKELNKAEYFRLLEAAKQKNNNRLYLLMQTICATGIRVSELKFITVDAVKAGRATVSLKGKSRQVLIPKTLLYELEIYIRKHDIKKGSVFVTKSGRPVDRSNILHEMKAICTLAKVNKNKVFPHNLRHLFACLYYKSEKDLSRLADILGHSSINTTRIYTCVSGTEQQRQIDRLGLVAEQKEIPRNIHYAVNQEMI